MVRNCAVCGGTEREILHRQEFYLPEGHPLAAGYDVAACQECGFVFADTVIDQAAYDLFYARRSKYEDSRTSTGSGLADWDARRLSDVADAIAGQVDGKAARILDLGCANGGLLAALKSKGFLKLTGVDPSEGCAASTREIHGIEAVAASLYSLPDLGFFDVITLSHVLEHLEDLRGAAQSFAGLLRPGGMVYIEVPDASRYLEFLIAPFQDFNTEHINHFSHQSLRRLMAAVGLVPFLEGTKTIESAKNMPYPALIGFYKAGSAQTEGRDHALVGRIRAYIQASQRMLEGMDRTIAAAIAKNRRVVIWGTGQLTSKLLKKTRLAEADIVSFIDSNPIHHGEIWMGKPVVSPQSLVDSTAALVIATTIHQDDIVAAIGRMGLRNELVLLRPVDESERDSRPRVLES